MNTVIFDNKENIKMVAHRGVSGLELENTCPAFVAAGVKSYYGVETDVHVTKDGKYIIAHDDDLKRIAGLDLILRETDFDVLRAIRLTDRDGVTKRADLFLPSLEEYMSICKKYEKIAVLELKEAMCENDVRGIATLTEKMGMLERTTFISFDKNNLLFLRKHFPSADAQFLSGNIEQDTVDFILNNGFDADIYHRAISKEFVDLMHENGRVVNVWTVDKLEDAERVKSLGVDMITSNILE